MPLKQSPFLYSEYKKYRSEKYNKLFPVLITIKRMLFSDSEIWNSFICGLSSLMEEYADVVQLSFIGFPINWKEILS